MKQRRRHASSTANAAATAPAGPRRRRLALCLVALAALTAVAYLNADHEQFLFDSGGWRQPIANFRTADLAGTFALLFRLPLRPGQEFSHLTFALSYSMNRAFGADGFNVTGFLVFNVTLHAINACLVFLLVRALLRRADPSMHDPIWIPLAAAMLFAVHPLQANSVVYIVQRRGALVATFYMLAVLAYLRVRSPQPTTVSATTAAAASSTWSNKWTAGRVALLATIPILFWLCIRSKTLGLTLPFAILMIELCMRLPDTRALKRFVPWLVGGIGLALAAALAFLASRGLFDFATFTIHPWGPTELWRPWAHFLTESRAFVHYWKLLFLPLPQWCCIDHSLAVSHSLTEHGALIAVLFHGALIATAIIAARKRALLFAVGVLWFYVALIPYVLLPQSELLVEYKTYLPSVGWALIIASLLQRLRRSVAMPTQVIAVTTLTGLLLATTIYRNRVFHDTYSLWSDAVAKSPENARAHNNLGLAFKSMDRLDDAIAEYRKAIKLNPRLGIAYNNLGNALLLQGRTDLAMTSLQASVELVPDYPPAHNNLGMALARMGRIDEAKPYFEQAVHLDPGYADAYSNLGNVLAAEGRYDDAIAHYRSALRCNPSLADAHNNLAAVLLQLGRTAEAVEHLKKVVALQPDSSQARQSLEAARRRLNSAHDAEVSNDSP